MESTPRAASPHAESPHADCVVPFLEHFLEHDRTPHRIELSPIPYQIGRESSSHYVIHSQRVSKSHAQILRSGSDFVLVDQNSTNGTFLNRQRISTARLKPNDIIHIADKELRFRLGPPESFSSADGKTVNGTQSLTDSLIHAWEMLKEVIRDELVQAVFQPIMNLVTGKIIGFELLSRVTHRELGANPAAALALADKLAIAPDLSHMFRVVGLRDAEKIPGPTTFFFNLHPSEMHDLASIDALAARAAAFRERGRGLVLEVHEDAYADTHTIGRLRERLRKMGIGLAFDDFGAGQSRLMELADAAPDFLKLDMKLVRGLDQAPARQDLVRALCEFAARLKVDMIAEGVETLAEANVCKQLGCTFAQGYLFGRPNPAHCFSMEDSTKTAPDSRLMSQMVQECCDRLDNGRAF